jgi:hypothetical protein
MTLTVKLPDIRIPILHGDQLLLQTDDNHPKPHEPFYQKPGTPVITA